MLKKLLVVGFLVAGASAALAGYSAQHDAALAHFKSGAESKVKDASWTSADIFKVGVFSDGSNRDGFANYVCEILYEQGFRGRKVWVQVIDIAVLKFKGKWIKLGEAHCL